MALIEKYRIYGNHQFGGNDRILKIYKEGYSGAVSNMRGATDPIIVRWPGQGDDDIYYPIVGTEVIGNIISSVPEEYIEFATAKNKDYFGVLYNVTVGFIEWQGWYVPEEWKERSALPQEISLTFRCGLGYLQDYDYLNAGAYYTGRVTEITIVARILAKILSSLGHLIFVVNSLLPTGGSTTSISTGMAQVYTDQNKYIHEDGTVWSCMDVLRDILEPYGCRIIMGSFGWWIIRVRDLALLREGKRVQWVRYTSAGAYQAWGYLADTTYMFSYTGNTNNRDTDVMWEQPTKMTTYERSWQHVKIDFDYLYRNILLGGTFLDNYTDFWTVAAGTVTLQQDNENPEKSVLAMVGSYASAPARVNQIIENISVEASDQVLLFRAEAMCQHSSVSEEFNVYTRVKFYIDADSGAINDTWIDGIIGDGIYVDRVPMWIKSDSILYISKQGIKTDEWFTVEITIPEILYTGDLTVELQNFVVVVGGVASVPDYCMWRNISLLGMKQDTIPTKKAEEEFTISTDNLIIPHPIKIVSGDIDEDGNEWVFYKGAKSTDADGDTLTTTWRSYYISGSTKTAYGPTQSLIEYLRDNYVIGRGNIRKRIEGILHADVNRMVASVYREGSSYFIPTSLKQSITSGRIQMSLVELPAIEDTIIHTNLISDVTNISFDTFIISDDPLIDVMSITLGNIGEADAYVITSILPYESFRVQVTGDFDQVYPLIEITIGSWSAEVGNNTNVIITPRTTIGSSEVNIKSQNHVDDVIHYNVLIKVTRIHGF